jgi:hypothetical protein
MQNKANVKIGKMNISIAKIKDYDKKQRTINNEHYSKQSQTKPISDVRMAFSPAAALKREIIYLRMVKDAYDRYSLLEMLKKLIIDN